MEEEIGRAVAPLDVVFPPIAQEIHDFDGLPDLLCHPVDKDAREVESNLPETGAHVFALGLIAVGGSLPEAVEVAFRQLPLPV
jgi:hypothetical protein